MHYAASRRGALFPETPATIAPAVKETPACPRWTTSRSIAATHVGEQPHRRPLRVRCQRPQRLGLLQFHPAAYARIGVTIPRTAGAQRNWLAAGNGFRVSPGQGATKATSSSSTPTRIEPDRARHARPMDQSKTLTIEAGGSKVDNYDYGRRVNNNIYEIWRVGATTRDSD